MVHFLHAFGCHDAAEHTVFERLGAHPVAEAVDHQIAEHDAEQVHGERGPESHGAQMHEITRGDDGDVFGDGQPQTAKQQNEKHPAIGEFHQILLEKPVHLNLRLRGRAFARGRACVLFQDERNVRAHQTYLGPTHSSMFPSGSWKKMMNRPGTTSVISPIIFTPSATRASWASCTLSTVNVR